MDERDERHERHERHERDEMIDVKNGAGNLPGENPAQSNGRAPISGMVKNVKSLFYSAHLGRRPRAAPHTSHRR